MSEWVSLHNVRILASLALPLIEDFNFTSDVADLFYLFFFIFCQYLN